jgi:hypothetical protein
MNPKAKNKMTARISECRLSIKSVSSPKVSAKLWNLNLPTLIVRIRKMQITENPINR